MRKLLIALLVLAAVATMALSLAPAADAADLAVTTARVHHRGHIIRDYDGTPIVLGRYRPTHPVWLGDHPGLVRVAGHFTRTYPVQQQPLPYIRRHAYYLGVYAPPYFGAGWSWRPHLAWWWY